MLDVNEAPSNIILSNQQVLENSQLNTVIGFISVIDPDILANQSHSCSLETSPKFIIFNSTLLTNAPLDYEKSSLETINIICIDSGHPPKSLQMSFPIAIIDVNEPPTDLSITNKNVPENCKCIVGYFAVTDPDQGDLHNFTLTSGGEDFEIFKNEIQTSRLLNFENRSVYLIEVVAMDIKGINKLN